MQLIKKALPTALTVAIMTPLFFIAALWLKAPPWTAVTFIVLGVLYVELWHSLTMSARFKPFEDSYRKHYRGDQ